MFKIDYLIISENFRINSSITDIDLRYNFLLGDVYLSTESAKIDMDWEWIPLLDFAYSLSLITDSLKENDISKEFFEFTESAETIEFLKHGSQVKVIPSFSSTVLVISFEAFKKAVKDFHSDISKHIRTKMQDRPEVLEKYLADV